MLFVILDLKKILNVALFPLKMYAIPRNGSYIASWLQTSIL